MKQQQTILAAVAMACGIGSSAAQETYTEWGRQIPAETSPRSIAQPEFEPENEAETPTASASDDADVRAEPADSDRQRDSEIETEIEALLRKDSDLDEGAVEVRVRDGVVELTGTVQSAEQKDRAIRTAWAIGAMTVDARGLNVGKAQREQR